MKFLLLGANSAILRSPPPPVHDLKIRNLENQGDPYLSDIPEEETLDDSNPAATAEGTGNNKETNISPSVRQRKTPQDLSRHSSGYDSVRSFEMEDQRH